MRLRQETRTRHKDDIFSRANASLASMMKQSVTEAAKIISQSTSDPSMTIIVSATASAMSRKQPESEEILYNLQRHQGAPSTRLKHTSVRVRELLGSRLGGDENGTRYYQNRLSSQAGFGSSGVICLDETSPGDGGGKLPAGGGVQETDDLWIQEFMNRDESEDLEDWERDILGKYIALIPAVTKQTTTSPPTKKQRCRLLTKPGISGPHRTSTHGTDD